MFDQSFEFRHINSQETLQPYHHISHNYAFRGKSGKRYIAIAEQHDHSIFCVKFCLAEHKRRPDRFNILSNLNECSRVITTISHIITHDLLKKDEFATFVFIGSNSPNEQINNTKRFRLYEKIITAKVSPVRFEHRILEEYSAYVIVNRDSSNPDILHLIVEKIKTVFDN